MELLKEIYERDLHWSERDGSYNRNGRKFWMRRTVRGVVFNAHYEIALIHIQGDNYYKLPGGGIQYEEKLEPVLAREVAEETGVAIAVENKLGLVIEYRDEHELIQFSYGFVARMIGQLPEPALTEEKTENGRIVQWMPLKEAFTVMTEHMPATYAGKFVQMRDAAFLRPLYRQGAKRL